MLFCIENSMIFLIDINLRKFAWVGTVVVNMQATLEYFLAVCGTT